MKQNKRKAKFGQRYVNLAMELRAEKLRLGDVVELREYIWTSPLARESVGGKRGVVVKVGDYGWDVDAWTGKRYLSGYWDVLVQFEGVNRLYGMDVMQLTKIPARQLRQERLMRNREREQKLYDKFKKWADDILLTAEQFQKFVRVLNFSADVVKSDFVLVH
jgi:hypothetical protein